MSAEEIPPSLPTRTRTSYEYFSNLLANARSVVQHTCKKRWEEVIVWHGILQDFLPPWVPQTQYLFAPIGNFRYVQAFPSKNMHSPLSQPMANVGLFLAYTMGS